jgi:signal transduction histidine kinase
MLMNLRQHEGGATSFPPHFSRLRSCTALQGYAEALNDEVLPPNHAASAILRETRVMERLASDLSLVSRVEAGQIELHHAAVSVAELLAAVGERFGALADDRVLTLTVRSVSPELRVWADPDRTGQVLANLVSNAIKYIPRGGRVALEVAPAPDHVQLNVSDSGPGLNAAEQQRVFERFYRADSSRSRAGGGGSGVGLTIARGLARAMGGELSVSAEPGQGSTFVLTLPIATPPTVR